LNILICVGFYVSSSIARRLGDSCNIDIFDKQPLPFGLIRYGVAPDHPEVKNCIHQFEQLVDRSDGRVRLFCNVAVGSDVTIDELRDNYNAVVLAYGAENERRLGSSFLLQWQPIGISLGVKGESANNCHSGRSFVGWYNGSLQHRNLDVNLDTETAVIIGKIVNFLINFN
jgi:adrenodoxin-NADP+ reductase